MTRKNVEYRVTPWKTLWFHSPHYKEVRIWKEFDGRHSWWQRHEWKHYDDTTFLEEWIPSIRGWPNKSYEITVDNSSEI